MAFTVTLPREQETDFWDSYGSEESRSANHLQTLFDEGKSQEYEETRAQYETEGQNFRLTDCEVFQIEDKGARGIVTLDFQVVAETITWYIRGPKDVTHQSFRDEIYRSAAIAHLTVENHCERYYRGTNSIHVKKMHTHEDEAGSNHNHYRVRSGRDVSVLDVTQHLRGFVAAQRKLGLIDASGREKFLDSKEAEQLITAFKVHSLSIDYIGPAKEATVDGQKFLLPEKEGLSGRQEFKETMEAMMSDEDRKEWEENQASEQPCRSIDPGLSLHEKLLMIRDSMRGIGAEKANTRQVEGSKHKTVATVVTKDDKKFSETDLAKGEVPEEGALAEGLASGMSAV